MGLFGTKPPEAKTVLILDVESGSVAGALVHLVPEERPKLFGETRVLLPVAFSTSGASLAAQVEHALGEVVQKLSELAGRLRNAAAAHARPMGTIERTIVFFAPPWGRPDLKAGKPQFLEDMSTKVRTTTEARLGRIPLSLYTSAGLAAFGNSALYEQEPALIYVVGGEVSDLLHFDGEGVRAHATVPFGEHALLRTLRTHGGLSELESRSMLRLVAYPEQGRGGRPSTSLRIFDEAFGAAAAHIGEQFASAATELLDGQPVARVRVMGGEPAAQWFAQALARHEPLGLIFPNGGEVRAMRAAHLTPFIAAHQEVPDTRLMLGALFVDSRFNS